MCSIHFQCPELNKILNRNRRQKFVVDALGQQTKTKQVINNNTFAKYKLFYHKLLCFIRKYYIPFLSFIMLLFYDVVNIFNVRVAYYRPLMQVVYC